MMVTTIQLSHDLKETLNRMKKTKKESYEEIIIQLVDTIEKQKRQERQLLVEGCKEMADESLKITKEFETIEGDLDWEW